jgi:hypothetical protein
MNAAPLSVHARNGSADSDRIAEKRNKKRGANCAPR